MPESYVILALVPKCSNPFFCKDLKPITYCNVVYKCITKIMVNCLKSLLPHFINQAQGVFMGGRRIGDNILLC